MDIPSVLTLAIAEASIVVAAGVVVTMWRRHRRQRRASRLRHPAAPPPVDICVVTDGGRPRWRVDVRSDVPPTAVDLASYRARDTGDWQEVSIVQPVLVGPGGWALLPGTAPADGDEFDVVMGWTVDHPDGPVTGSRTFLVTATGGPAHDRFRRRSAPTLGTVPALVVLATLVGGATFVGAALWDAVSAEVEAQTSDR